MFSDVKYLDYNENKYMIDDYFYIMLEWRKSKALEALKNYCNKRGNAVNEEMRCSFADEIPVEDEEYFGASGVVFYVDYPAADEDSAIIVSYQEFYDIVEEKFKEFAKKNSEKSLEINILLEKLYNNLQLK